MRTSEYGFLTGVEGVKGGHERLKDGAVNKSRDENLRVRMRDTGAFFRLFYGLCCLWAPAYPSVAPILFLGTLP